MINNHTAKFKNTNKGAYFIKNTFMNFTDLLNNLNILSNYRNFFDLMNRNKLTTKWKW